MTSMELLTPEVTVQTTSIAVVLIAKDEASHIARAVGSVAQWADEVIVYDTGSTDGTPELAAKAGAEVIHGFWNDDFARARNAALAAVQSDWVLSLDADEVATVDIAGFGAFLNAVSQDQLGFSVRIDNVGAQGDDHSYQHAAPRLFRRHNMVWVGRVHEQPEPADGSTYRWPELPKGLVTITHHGYADESTVKAKAQRNVRILQDLVDEALDSGQTAGLAEILLDLGRSQLSVGQLQAAVTSFETVREIAPASPQWNQATDFLARMMLADGQDEVVLALVQEMETADLDQKYCDWLRAQALAYLGHPAEALELLRAIDHLVDPAGRSYDLGRVLEIRSLVAQLAGHQAEAQTALLGAMTGYGRIHGRGARLLELWGQAPLATLAQKLTAPSAAAHRDALLAEFSGLGAAGEELAGLLGAQPVTAQPLTAQPLTAQPLTARRP